MKNIRKIVVVVMAYITLTAIVPALDVQAAAVEFPTKFRIYNCDGTSEETIVIQISDHHTYVDNVKSGSTNLIVGLTDYNYSSNSSAKDTYTLSFIAKKKGTYNISYDLMKDGKKTKTIKAKVYAYPEPISITLDGDESCCYWEKTSAKLCAKAAAGNTIAKIEVGTYNLDDSKKNGNYAASLEYLTVKNNSKIKLGTTGRLSYRQNVFESNGKSNLNEQKIEDIVSYTYIRVTYKDKYTKKNEEFTCLCKGIAG